MSGKTSTESQIRPIKFDEDDGDQIVQLCELHLWATRDAGVWGAVSVELTDCVESINVIAKVWSSTRMMPFH